MDFYYDSEIMLIMIFFSRFKLPLPEVFPSGKYEQSPYNCCFLQLFCRVREKIAIPLALFIIFFGVGAFTGVQKSIFMIYSSENSTKRKPFMI